MMFRNKTFFSPGAKLLGQTLAMGAAMFALASMVFTPPPLAAQGTNVNAYKFVSPANCSLTATTLAFTAAPLMTAAGLQVTTNAAAGTIGVRCPLMAQGGLAGRARVRMVELYYAVQTNAIGSIAAATITRDTFAGSTLSPGVTTDSTPGGVLTASPTVLLLATSATGVCNVERITPATPVQLNQLSSLFINQTFTFGAAASTLQICGVALYLDTR